MDEKTRQLYSDLPAMLRELQRLSGHYLGQLEAMQQAQRLNERMMLAEVMKRRIKEPTNRKERRDTNG
jgi:hypothetical protein